LGDQQAALVGHLCFMRGEAKNTYGTGCFLLINTGEEIVHSKHGLTTVGSVDTLHPAPLTPHHRTRVRTARSLGNTLRYQLGPKEAPFYALEGAIAMAGESVRWLLQDMQLVSTYSEIGAISYYR
jgi:glycerol kinase